MRYAWTSSLGGFLFLNTLYLQDVRGFNPLVAGFCLLPMAVMLALCAPLSGRIVASSGARIPLVAAAHRGPARTGQREVTRPDEKREYLTQVRALTPGAGLPGGGRSTWGGRSTYVPASHG